MTYPWRFMGFLVLALLVPKLYELTSVFWVGRISLDALSIAEQFEFIGVSMEVINEGATCGVLALVARARQDREHVASTVRLGLLLALIGSCALTLAAILGGDHFVRTVGTPPAIATLTRRYLAIRSLAAPLDAAALVFLVALKALGRGWEALRLVSLGVLLTALLDLLLISNTPISLHLGIPGLAIGQVIGKLGLLLLAHSSFRRYAGTLRGRPTRGLSKLFASVGVWGGLDSLVRNLGYLSLLALLNGLGPDPFGGYGLAMTLIWTALVPVLALGEGTSVGVGHLHGDHDARAQARLVATSAALGLCYMALIGGTGALLLRPLLTWLNPNLALTACAERTLRWLILPYLSFTLSLCLKSLFFGTGRTRYILLISLLTNGLLIAPYRILVTLRYLSVSFEGVMSLFVVVMSVDLILAALFALHLLRRARREQ